MLINHCDINKAPTSVYASIGGDSGFGSDQFVSTGYGTYSGAGNTQTGAEKQQGTGYDEHGRVKTSFGRWKIDYDPVTGAAQTGVTAQYHFPGMDLEAVTEGHAYGNDSGGLTDVSLPAAGHSTVSKETKERQREASEEGKEVQRGG